MGADGPVSRKSEVSGSVGQREGSLGDGVGGMGPDRGVGGAGDNGVGASRAGRHRDPRPRRGGQTGGRLGALWFGPTTLVAQTAQSRIGSQVDVALRDVVAHKGRRVLVRGGRVWPRP